MMPTFIALRAKHKVDAAAPLTPEGEAQYRILWEPLGEIDAPSAEYALEAAILTWPYCRSGLAIALLHVHRAPRITLAS